MPFSRASFVLADLRVFGLGWPPRHPGCAAQDPPARGTGSFGKGLREVQRARGFASSSGRCRAAQRRRKAQGKPALRYDDDWPAWPAHTRRTCAIMVFSSTCRRHRNAGERLDPPATCFSSPARTSPRPTRSSGGGGLDEESSTPREHHGRRRHARGIGIVEAVRSRLRDALHAALCPAAQLETASRSPILMLDPTARARRIGRLPRSVLSATWPGGARKMPDNPEHATLPIRDREARLARIRCPSPGPRVSDILADTSAFEVSEALLRRGALLWMAVERSSAPQATHAASPRPGRTVTSRRRAARWVDRLA